MARSLTFFDDRALDQATKLDLPTDAVRLAALAPPRQVARLAAALVRADLAGWR